MLHVTGNNGNVINYLCDCGTKGFCIIKPVEDDSAIVVDIKCPECFQKKRILILQYSSEESRDKMVNNLNSIDYSWSLILNNKAVV